MLCYKFALYSISPAEGIDFILSAESVLVILTQLRAKRNSSRDFDLCVIVYRRVEHSRLAADIKCFLRELRAPCS